MAQAADNNMKRKELDELKSKFGIKTQDEQMITMDVVEIVVATVVVR